jgi:hypothetical protein
VSVVPEPDRVDVQRPKASEHLVFGRGIHLCTAAMAVRNVSPSGASSRRRFSPAGRADVLDLRAGGLARERPWCGSRGIDPIGVREEPHARIGLDELDFQVGAADGGRCAVVESWREEVAIRSLVDRYADAVFRADDRELAATWADDGEWSILDRTAKGRDEIGALFRELTGGLSKIVQVPSGGVIEREGNAATGRWTVTEYAWLADGTPLLTLGRYRDQYVLVDGAWLFRRREFAPIYMGPPNLAGQAPAA